MLGFLTPLQGLHFLQDICTPFSNSGFLPISTKYQDFLSILAPIAVKLDYLFVVSSFSAEAHMVVPMRLDWPALVKGIPQAPGILKRPVMEGGSGVFHSSFFMSLVLKSMFSQTTDAVRISITSALINQYIDILSTLFPTRDTHSANSKKNHSSKCHCLAYSP